MQGGSGSAVTIDAILGCWRLERAIEERGGIAGPNPTYGASPDGYLHYLAGGRVAVTIPLGERRRMSGTNRRAAPTEELAESARTFDAYAGGFTLVGGGRIVHHVDVASYQNQVGTDLERGIELEGDLLRLRVPDFDDNGVTVRRWLEWRRVPGT